MKDHSDLLTIEQAAIFLNVSETSLRRWTNDGRLPCARIGQKRIRRFRREDLVAFLDMGSADNITVSDRSKQTFIGGVAVDHGMHLCCFYTSETGRAKLGIEFIADGLQQDCACHITCAPKAESEILTQLRHYRPGYQKDMASGRLVISRFCETPSQELEKLEKSFRAALDTGARTIRLVSDVSQGLMAQVNKFKYVLQYENDLNDRLCKKFPLVTMCQYDARKHSGTDMVEIMKCHRDDFCYPPDRLLY